MLGGKCCFEAFQFKVIAICLRKHVPIIGQSFLIPIEDGVWYSNMMSGSNYRLNWDLFSSVRPVLRFPQFFFFLQQIRKRVLLSSKSSVFQVGSQTQIGPPPNYLENDFETTLQSRQERRRANFNNHVLRMITEGQSQHTTESQLWFGDSTRTSIL